MRLCTTTTIGLLAFLSLLPVAARAQHLTLLRNVSPTVERPRRFAFSLEGGYETGAIPTAVISPRLSYGVLDNLQAGIGFTFASFTDVEDRRLAGLEGDLRYRIGKIDPMGLELFAFGGAAYAPGDEVTAPYRDDLSRVHTVIAEHGDPGLDLFAGALATSGPLIEAQPVRLGISGEYARTGMREYYPPFEQESHKNRVRVNLFPFLELAAGELSMTAALQNRYTYWFDRGTMFELLPQLSITPTERFDLAVGASIPAVGGKVYKLLLQTNIRFEVAVEREIRIKVRDLHFPPDQAILFGPENEKSAQNRRRIRRLYRKLEKYPDYTIVVEGHTSWVYWDDPVRGPEEQEEVLIPLSRARAKAVMEALAELGLPSSRMSYVGKGGSEPEVPFDDPQQWRNRRVEIVLAKE